MVGFFANGQLEYLSFNKLQHVSNGTAPEAKRVRTGRRGEIAGLACRPAKEGGFYHAKARENMDYTEMQMIMLPFDQAPAIVFFDETCRHSSSCTCSI